MPTQRGKGVKLEDLAGTYPKGSSFAMLDIHKCRTVMSLAGRAWSDLIIEEASCFFGAKGEKRIKEQEQTLRKGRLVATLLPSPSADWAVG